MNGSPGDHGTRHEGLDRGIIPLEGSTMTTPGGTIAAAAVPLVLALTPGGTALAERFPPTASAAPAPRVREETVDLRPLWDTERVLRNPGKGFYHHLLDNGVERYAIRDEAAFRSFPGMDHLYLRLAWSFLEPREGEYDWSRIDEVVAKYVPLGYGIAFRVTSKETGRAPGVVGHERDGVQYATPVWVRAAGAAGVVSEAWGVRSFTPDWDDPVYLAGSTASSGRSPRATTASRGCATSTRARSASGARATRASPRRCLPRSTR
jgi:hypothetical protein